MGWVMRDDALVLVGRVPDEGAAVLGRVIRPTRPMGSYIWEVADGSVGGVATTQSCAMRALEREVRGADAGRCRPRLAATRRALGLTQAEAAERAGVTRDAWIKWEQGDATPYRASRIKIARALGMPDDPDVVEADMDWLLEVV